MLKKYHLRSILVVFTFAMLGLFMLIANYVISIHAEEVITKNVATNATELLTEINELINEEFRGIESLATSLCMNATIRNELVNTLPRQQGMYEQIVALQAIDETLRNYGSMSNDISRILIYTDSLPLYRYAIAWNIDCVRGKDMESYRELIAMMDGRLSGFTPIYKEISRAENGRRIYVPEILYFRSLKTFPSDETDCLLVVGIKENSIREKFGEIFTKNQPYYLLDDREQIILTNATKEQHSMMQLGTEAGYQKVQIKGEAYLMLFTGFSDHGMRAVHFVPYASIIHSLPTLTYKIALTLVLLCMAAFPLLFVMMYAITKPMNRMVEKMRRLGDGYFQVQPDDKAISYEMVMIDQSFVTMAHQIQQLLAKVEEEDRRNREATLNALQYQIDPHFLCNSLDAVNWMAIRIHADEISEMVAHIGKFYRLALRGSNDTVSVRDELELLHNYIGLQRVCFPGNLTYEEDVEENILDLQMLRVLLQPIVENSLKHAFERTASDNAIILVSGWREDDDLFLKISDNGKGLNVAEANAMLAEAEAPQRRYGLKNVYTRIKLYYGEPYGLEYLPVNKGTVALIRIPAVKGDD